MIYRTLILEENFVTALLTSLLRCRRLVFAVSLFAALVCLTAITGRADTVDDFIRRQIRKRHIPGLSLAIVRDGKIVKAAGYGFANVELGARATPQTVYCLASMSKQFAAAAILLLVQDGKVSLDAPIGTYLAGAPDTWKEITVRRLLTHTSGLPREGAADNGQDGPRGFQPRGDLEGGDRAAASVETG